MDYTAWEVKKQGFLPQVVFGQSQDADTDPNFLVNVMKFLWKILDSHLLFVRYPFIMDIRLILEESARG